MGVTLPGIRSSEATRFPVPGTRKAAPEPEAALAQEWSVAQPEYGFASMIFTVTDLPFGAS